MLRRPLTVLTITPEDIADYEDRLLDRKRLLEQQKLALLAAAQQQHRENRRAATTAASSSNLTVSSPHQTRTLVPSSPPQGCLSSPPEHQFTSEEEEEEEEEESFYARDEMDIDGSSLMIQHQQETPTNIGRNGGAGMPPPVVRRGMREREMGTPMGPPPVTRLMRSAGRGNVQQQLQEVVTPEARGNPRSMEERIGVAAPRRGRGGGQ
ncbi:hypothetical protein QBC38DRAFT_481400 [Podospora fimiseda]|uniref:Anaphase-promoting complex subunit CDC26 n=1 Tax=Podospora fimiseda TaxID=252190 RepID=A0AAN7BMJ6_9PEZI|nr:hypothetical protein QBC38DRAFT_481400 [Podospora fimiseda]